MSVSPLSSLVFQARADDAIVAFSEKGAVTQAQFIKDVRRIASFFEGKRAVALICDDSYLFAVGLWGLFHAGVHVVLPPGNQQAVLELIQDSYDVIVDDQALQEACSHSQEADLKPLDSEKHVVDFCTSGSTGNPKFVPKNLKAFDAEIAIMDKIFDLKKASAVFSTVPHYHVYGFTFKIVWALAAGHIITAKTYSLWESLFPDFTDSAVLVSSPAHLGRMDGLDALHSSKKIQLVLSAGAPLPLEASRTAERILCKRPLEIFGSTETGAIATRTQEKENEPWHVIPKVEVRCQENGHMLLSSPFVEEEWLKTSDLIELVDGGFIHKGRGDRIVKIESKRVSLSAVEALLKKHPMVKDIAVILLADSNRLAAAVVLNDTGREALERQGAFCLTRVFKSFVLKIGDAEACPRSWRFIDAFPYHAMGKRCESDVVGLFEERT